MNTIMQWRKYPDFKPEEETLYLVMATCMPTSSIRLEDAYELAEYDKKKAGSSKPGLCATMLRCHTGRRYPSRQVAACL